MTSIVWFRDDLRLADNPALNAAAERGEGVIALWLLDEDSTGVRPLGGASRWWLHHSLLALEAELAEYGVQLVRRRGAAETVLPELARETGASAVFWNRRYSLVEREIDARLKSSLRESGVEVTSFQANLLFEPWTIRTGGGTSYGVFTPFWKACLAQPKPRAPLPVPAKLSGAAQVASDALTTWQLLPTKPDWSGGLAEHWQPGEAGAHNRLEHFLAGPIDDYADGRDHTDREATSRLSPHLRWGEVSPFQVWHAAERVRAGRDNQVRKFLSEVGWREFAWHVLFHFPDLATKNMRADFNALQWNKPGLALRLWQQGETGIDLVDAGMKELWQSGYMHNRVRMVTASFLTKNLLIDWREGEAWFWDCLVDADAAANPFSWQWVAGSGADAAPYFRVFNPELQAEKFDGKRIYRDRWLGEGLRPSPMVDLKASREAALTAYERVSAEKAARARESDGKA